MIVFRGRGLALVGAVVASLGLAVTAVAAPLLIGDTECGDLKKRTVEGRVVWQITDCAPLEELVNPPAATCGDGQINGSEFCDQSAAPTGCGDTDTCVGCVECTSQPVITPTPTPKPGATPTPPLVTLECPRGELPPLNSEEFGVIRVGIEDGETHAYCFTLHNDAIALDFDAIDGTGAAQCFWADAMVVTPPLGSGLSVKTTFGSNAHVGYFRSGLPIAKGTYRLAITAREDSGCSQRYTVSARFR